MICFQSLIRMPRRSGLWLGTALALVLLGTSSPHTAAGQAAEVQTLLERGRAAGVDAGQMQLIAKRARRVGLSPKATASLLRPTIALAEQDLPTAPLLSKTLEGLAKRVPAARMTPVLREYRTHTERAGKFVRQWTRRSDVQKLLGSSETSSGSSTFPTQLVMAVAEAQQQDLPAKDIRTFLNGLPSDVKNHPVSTDQVAAAVGVLPDLSGNGSPAGAARELMTSALSAGYSPESLRQLPSALQSAHQKSKRPVGTLASGAAQTIARGTPAATVLQSLFQGRLPGGAPPSRTGPSGSAPGPGKTPPADPPGKGPPDDPPGSGGPPDDPDGGSS